MMNWFKIDDDEWPEYWIFMAGLVSLVILMYLIGRIF